MQKLYRVYARPVNKETMGQNLLQNFSPLWKNVLDIVKKFGPLSENSLSPWCPQMIV